MPQSKTTLKYTIGVDLGGTNVRVGIVSSKGKILYSLKSPIPRKRNRKTLLHHIAELVEGNLDWAKQKKLKIQGIGLGSPGVLSIKKGIVRQSPNLPEWVNVSIAQYFKKRFKLPFVLENDANAAALSEAWIGAGKKANSVICVTLGTGVGGGIVLNHKIWHGYNDGGGEIGHIVIRDQGEKCRCGNWGCLEVYASATGIVRYAKKLLKTTETKSFLRDQPISSQAIFAAARKKDRLALKVTQHAAEMLGAGLASLVHIFNPEIIVVGGGVSLNKNLFPPLRAAVKKRCFTQLTQHLKIVPAQLGDNAGLIGAARAYFIKHS